DHRDRARHAAHLRGQRRADRPGGRVADRTRPPGGRADRSPRGGGIPRWDRGRRATIGERHRPQTPPCAGHVPMTRARHAAFGAATALSCVAVLAAPARASSVAIKVDGVAWWSRQPGAAAQPAGGFQLAYGVDGAESEAAMRVTVPQVSGLKATLVLA